MSLKDGDDNDVNHFDTTAIMRYTEKSHRVKWTIEAVSKLPDSVEKQGPDFSVKNFRMTLLVQKLGNELSIYLMNTSYKSFRIDSNLALFDCEGNKLQERIKQDEIFEKNKSFAILWKLKSLKYDQLIINCSLKMVEHVTKSLRPLKSEEENQKKLLDDLKMAYNSPDGSDFTLKFGEDLIYAHKTILSLRSTYFKTMFETDMKEKLQNSTLITDVSYSTMKNLVKFLYTGSFTMAKEDDFVQEVRKLYIASDKYQVIDLRSLCADELLSKATDENVLETLQLALNYNDERLKTEAMNLIPFYFDKILKSNAWKAFLISDVDLASEITIFCFNKK